MRSRFYWRGHGEVTKKNEVEGQQEETVRGHEIFKHIMRGLKIPRFLLRGRGQMSSYQVIVILIFKMFRLTMFLKRNIVHPFCYLKFKRRMFSAWMSK